MEKYYSVKHIADMVGLSPYTIRKYVRNGVIKGERISGARAVIRVSETELKRFIDSFKK